MDLFNYSNTLYYYYTTIPLLLKESVKRNKSRISTQIVDPCLVNTFRDDSFYERIAR